MASDSDSEWIDEEADESDVSSASDEDPPAFSGSAPRARLAGSERSGLLALLDDEEPITTAIKPEDPPVRSCRVLRRCVLPEASGGRGEPRTRHQAVATAESEDEAQATNQRQRRRGEHGVKSDALVILWIRTRLVVIRSFSQGFQFADQMNDFDSVAVRICAF
jgi:hypothetical protein